MAEVFEVAVLGGGPAGCVVARLLAQNGCRVAVLEKSRSSQFAIGETMPPQISRLLSELDLLDRFRALGPLPSAGIVSVWGSPAPIANDFVFSPHGNGWHIDRSRFNRMLADAATEAGATFIDHARVDTCEENPADWTLEISTPGCSRTFRSRLVVDARGRAAAGLFGFPGRTVLDRLIAVAGLVPARSDATRCDFTLVEAVDEGWFYSALLPCGEYVLAYMTDADLYASGRARTKCFFENQLNRAPCTLERIEAVPASVTVFSAATSIRASAVRRRWIAVGDAARSYDPLSGLGLLSAISMARQSASVILNLLDGDADSVAGFTKAHLEAFRAYRNAHSLYYSAEQRWPESAFWRRRTDARLQVSS